MKIEQLVNLHVLLEHKLSRVVLPVFAIFGICLTNYLVFMVVPSEKVMGAVQRIFYFHVGSAMSAYGFIAMLFVASIFFLVSRKIHWDLLAQSAALIALLFCSIVLATGMIWGHSAWNTWWRWEPRLVSFLVLWLVLLSYQLLRSFSVSNTKVRNFAAVLGIFAAVNVPIVIFSIKLLDQTQQLHPEVVANQGLKDSRFLFTLMVANLAVPLMGLWLFVVKLQSLLLADRVEKVLRSSNRRK